MELTYILKRFSYAGQMYAPGIWEVTPDIEGQLAGWYESGRAREVTPEEQAAYEAHEAQTDLPTLQDAMDSYATALKGTATSAGDTMGELEALIPAKGSASDLDTGTNDTKFMTAKSIKDSTKLGGLMGVTPKADGTYTPVTITISKGLITEVTEA